MGGNVAGCYTHRDWRELIARPDLDAVIVATPDHWHVPMALSAMRAGKDVACEKPLTRSIADGRKLANLAARRKAVFRTDSEFRSNRTMHRAVEMVRNGKIGRLERVITGTPKDPLRVETPPTMPVPAELDYELDLRFSNAATGADVAGILANVASARGIDPKRLFVSTAPGPEDLLSLLVRLDPPATDGAP